MNIRMHEPTETQANFSDQSSYRQRTALKSPRNKQLRDSNLLPLHSQKLLHR